MDGLSPKNSNKQLLKDFCMRSNELDLTIYNSDKIESNYLRKYDPVFKDYVHKPIKL